MKKAAEEKFIINGPVGKLEALLSCGPDEGSYIAVICHPHPLHGGTMTNKVVHYTAKSFNEMGVPVLRFNFRGVGASEGEFGNAIGEADDLAAAVRWTMKEYPGRRLLLAGFSFGSFVAVSRAASLDSAGLLLIAPAINLYDFRQIELPSCPWLVIQGDADEVVPPKIVKQWAEETAEVDRLVYMPGAGHFFHGRLLDLSSAIKAWMTDAFDLD